jgi:hypothetical protein
MRRKHHKIQELPPEIVAAVNEWLARGKTYAQIAERLRESGHEVGTSSVGRYHQSITSAARELNLISEQIKPVLAQVRENPNLELGSVAAQIGLVKVIELMNSDKLDDEKSRASALSSLCAAASMLQRSQAAAEKYRMEWVKEAQKIKAEIAAAAKDDGLTQEKIDRIFQKLTGV